MRETEITRARALGLMEQVVRAIPNQLGGPSDEGWEPGLEGAVGLFEGLGELQAPQPLQRELGAILQDTLARLPELTKGKRDETYCRGVKERLAPRVNAVIAQAEKKGP